MIIMSMIIITVLILIAIVKKTKKLLKLQRKVKSAEVKRLTNRLLGG